MRSSVQFACEADAVSAVNRLYKQLKSHVWRQIKAVEVTVKLEAEPTDNTNNNRSAVFKVQAQLELDAGVIDKETKASGRFILATNVMDAEQLSPEQMIIKYKEQQATERGFGFLKDPGFFTDSVFLKSPEIEALTLVMGLCLLVYTLGQRSLRRSLQPTNSTVKNQLGKGTNKPTRGIFQGFQSIYAPIQGVKQISNLTAERMRILNFFPGRCQDYYLLL